MKVILLFLFFSWAAFAETTPDTAKSKDSAEQTESTISRLEDPETREFDIEEGIKVRFEAQNPVYLHKGTGSRGFSIVDGKMYRSHNGPPENILTKGVFYLGDQAIPLDVSGIGDPWVRRWTVTSPICYLKKLDNQAGYILRVPFFKLSSDDFYIEWCIYNGRSLRTAIVEVGNDYPQWYLEQKSATLDIGKGQMTCGEMFEFCEEKIKKGACSVKLVKGDECMEILAYWDEWSDIYYTLLSGKDVDSNEKQMGFKILIKDEKVVTEYDKYDLKRMDDLIKILKDLCPERKICFFAYLDPSCKNKPFSEIWGLLYPLHKLSEGRFGIGFGEDKDEE